MNLPRDLKIRQGAASIVALLATLVIVAVATAVWVTALGSAQEARVVHGAVQARVAAETGVRAFGRSLPTIASLPLGASQVLGTHPLAAGISAQARLMRVGRETYLLRGDGRTTNPYATRSIGYAFWVLHPTARLAAAGGVVSLGGVLRANPGSTIDSGSINVVPPGWSALCAPVVPSADSVFPAGVLAALTVDTTTAVRLGQLDQRWLTANATSVVGGAVTPAATLGPLGCLTSDPANWGDPSGSGICSMHRPLITTGGNLVVAGGQGQGVLIVPGDLTLRGGAQFFGMILVGGSLQLSEGSRLWGMARVQGDVLLTGGTILGSSCPTLLSLSHPAFAGWHPLPEAWIDPV